VHTGASSAAPVGSSSATSSAGSMRYRCGAKLEPHVAVTNLNLKNVPADLHRRLKARARRHRQSLNCEVIQCLLEATSSTPVEPEALLERVRELRSQVKGRLKPSTLARLKGRGRA
jgi:plasmid stability protein